MKRKILVTAAVTVALVMTGCAQKKLNTTDSSTPLTSGANGTNTYENVDPLAGGIGQGSGLYGQDGSLYGDSGLKKIYFDVDQYHITADKLGVISHNANLLRNSNKIKIEGHCDATGSDEYNYALGLRRAKAAKDALQANGVSANKMILVSMGESAPDCIIDSSAECYAKNRRVEFKVMQ